MDAAQCAAVLHCSKDTVEGLAGRGELPATRFGRGWVFVTEQVLEFLRLRSEREAAERRAGIRAVPSGKAKASHPELRAAKLRGRPRKSVPALS